MSCERTVSDPGKETWGQFHAAALQKTCFTVKSWNLTWNMYFLATDTIISFKIHTLWSDTNLIHHLIEFNGMVQLCIRIIKRLVSNPSTAWCEKGQFKGKNLPIVATEIQQNKCDCKGTLQHLSLVLPNSPGSSSSPVVPIILANFCLWSLLLRKRMRRRSLFLSLRIRKMKSSMLIKRALRMLQTSAARCNCGLKRIDH